ncbi:SH3 domain-containing protein [Coleofasciculus sp. LEGE 07092]|nr:SH3 domain-containing protein [Coleofasciculus sp. LEGE 07081]MBE9148695.1 SH3 domain-containing protein [Coleofasciculus sp. LEGE 07092]
MSLSGITKFFLGFTLGISLLLGTSVAAAYYFYTKLSVNPPRPIFAEEQQPEKPIAQPVKAPKASSQNNPSKPSPAPSKSPATAALPPGAYTAKVSWPEGLSLRDSPGLEASRIGGVAYNQEIIVLQESDDKKWQKVRLAEGEQEGWVKAGNIERVDN